MNNIVHLVDCMELIKDKPNNYYDLAIVDPPYGIGVSKRTWGGGCRAKVTNYGKKEWDNQSPDKEYFNELIRVSKNQIIWGANHFISKIPFDSSCWIVWDKDHTCDFADCELAWTSFALAVRKFTFRWNGMLQGDMKNKERRIHPTQKPVALYNWLLAKYAKSGDKILDTHVGSGSIRIAAYEGGFWFEGAELDHDYFNAQELRFKNHIKQARLAL